MVLAMHFSLASVVVILACARALSDESSWHPTCTVQLGDGLESDGNCTRKKPCGVDVCGAYVNRYCSTAAHSLTRAHAPYFSLFH